MLQDRSKKLIRILIVLIIGLVALGVRLNFAEQHAVGEDEPTYLTSALNYTNFIRLGKYRQLAWHEENLQHPVLTKILYGVVLLTQPPLEKMHNKYFTTGLPIQEAQGRPWAMAARIASVITGAIASLVIAAVDPLAGLFFASQSLLAVSTSLVGLEALPLLTSFLSVYFYSKWAKQNLRVGSRSTGSAWLALSAITLGITGASKYTYCVVGLVILIHYLIHCIREPKLFGLLPKIAVWMALSVMIFFLFDPYLWPDPYVRLRKSLFFVVSYPQSPSVNGTDLPFWQPLIWLSSPFSAYIPILGTKWVIAPDRLIFVLALIGLPGLWKRVNEQRNGQAEPLAGGISGKQGRGGIFRLYRGRLEGSEIYLIWLVTGLLVSMVWPTKWPQYVLIFLVPVCFSASQGAWMIYAWVRERLRPRLQPATE